MYFIIDKIDTFIDYNQYFCTFYNEDNSQEFMTYIGKPEIDSAPKVLLILGANCDYVFGGNGSINLNENKFNNETEIKIGFKYEI